MGDEFSVDAQSEYADLAARYAAQRADGETQPLVAVAPRTDYLSGALQGALALGTSYLSRRMDIDLQSRIVGAQPTVARPSNQRPVNDHADLTTRAVASAGGLRIGDVLPWLVAGLIGWVVLKPKG